ncbi:hypothetical protein D7Z54_00485 [Salibacterium salarium]|uniref:Uncharacterized protein n=1 Tax=Salibacterium salarium TaxID=284579 RepID=A0A3R9PBZ4_9BACI|nr:hypothetical protein D7Z54_00485 [Salibacterium salarium]
MNIELDRVSKNLEKRKKQVLSGNRDRFLLVAVVEKRERRSTCKLSMEEFDLGMISEVSCALFVMLVILHGKNVYAMYRKSPTFVSIANTEHSM